MGNRGGFELLGVDGCEGYGGGADPDVGAAVVEDPFNGPDDGLLPCFGVSIKADPGLLAAIATFCSSASCFALLLSSRAELWR